MTRVISKPQGRPVSTGRGDAVRVTVRLSEEEAATYERAAKRRGVTVAAYLRERSWGDATIDAGLSIIDEHDAKRLRRRGMEGER